MKSTVAEMIGGADSIEISQLITRIALFEWDAERRTWYEAQPGYHAERDGRTMWAMLDLARRARLEVVAWRDGERMP